MSINLFVKNAIIFIVLSLLQIIVFNNIEITSIGIIPVFFILFVLLLPYETPDWILISSAFLIGITVDVFTDSWGLYAASTVFIAFIRPTVLKSLAPRDGYEAATSPRIYYMGLGWFVKYAAIMIFAQQIFYFILADYSMLVWTNAIIKVFIGTFISILLILVSQFVIFRK